MLFWNGKVSKLSYFTFILKDRMNPTVQGKSDALSVYVV